MNVEDTMNITQEKNPFETCLTGQKLCRTGIGNKYKVSAGTMCKMFVSQELLVGPVDLVGPDR